MSWPATHTQDTIPQYRPPVPDASAAESHDATLDAVRKLESQLIALQRLALAGNMTSMVLHEINNLITPILGRADFALSTRREDDMIKALERAKIQAEEITAVTQRMRTLIRPGAPQRQRCSVAGTVHEALDIMTRPLQKDRIELRQAIAPELSIMADPGLFRQVLLNLLLNAREAMSERGGTLTVRAEAENGSAVIEVSDQGSGLDQAKLDQIINPFLASTNNEDALNWQEIGLGLNVCRIIAQRYGATISARRNDTIGTTFTLRWPQATPIGEV